MGDYYAVACDELKESIDPGAINNLGVKAESVAHPNHPLGAVVIFALLNRWSGKAVRVANDFGYDPGYFKYRDITREVLKEYNEYYKTKLRYTGEDDE